jgi:hypothetical protein
LDNDCAKGTFTVSFREKFIFYPGYLRLTGIPEGKGTCSFRRVEIVSSRRDSYGRISGAERSESHARCSFDIKDVLSCTESSYEEKSYSTSIILVVQKDAYKKIGIKYWSKLELLTEPARHVIKGKVRRIGRYVTYLWDSALLSNASLL